MTLGVLREMMRELLNDFPDEAVVLIEREDEDNFLVVRTESGRKLVTRVTA